MSTQLVYNLIPVGFNLAFCDILKFFPVNSTIISLTQNDMISSYLPCFPNEIGKYSEGYTEAQRKNTDADILV